MSSSGKIRVPAEEYVIYFPPTDQSDSRITLNCSINIISIGCLLFIMFYLIPTFRKKLSQCGLSLRVHATN